MSVGRASERPRLPPRRPRERDGPSPSELHVSLCEAQATHDVTARAASHPASASLNTRRAELPVNLSVDHLTWDWKELPQALQRAA